MTEAPPAPQLKVLVFAASLRAESLNRKLAVIAESAQVLTDIIDTRRSLRLEVIIVLLILFEVIMTIYQLAIGRHT